MNTKSWHFCILIPARNEEKLLPRCLDSIILAASALPPYCTYDITLAVDSSSDQTYSLGKKIIDCHGSVIDVEEKIVGKVRMLAANEALKRYHGPLSACWLANTDADCIVPPTWLIHHLSIANNNIQAVAGIVSVDSFAEHLPCVAQRFKESYTIHADGTHPHIHGANFGVRADAYRLAGGWTELKTAEDHDLWNRLKILGIPMLSDSSLTVITSGRRMGRAPMGFADALAAHNKDQYDSK